jgi:hypothetical protein
MGDDGGEKIDLVSERVPAEIGALLIEFVEKVGLLRRDLQHRNELEHFEARVKRIEQKLSALAEAVSAQDPELAKAIRTAWQLPARSLAFRNAEHQKQEG